jgi:hypothetical protein
MISHSDKNSFAIDELMTINHIRYGQTIKDLFLNYANSMDVTSPGFSFIAYFWYRLVPYGERWLYLLPELLTALAVFFIGILVRKAVGIKGAVFVTITVSTLLVLGQFGNNFRGYPLYLLLSALVFYLYVKRLEQRGNEKLIDILIFAMVLVGFVCSHYVAVIICLVFFIFDVILICKKKIRFNCLLSYILGAIIFCPVAVPMLLFSGKSFLTFWAQAPAITSIISVAQWLFNDNLLLQSFFLLGCSMITIKIIKDKKINFSDLPLLIAIIAPFFMVGVVYIYSRYINIGGSFFVDRYFLGLIPMLAFVCGYTFEIICKMLEEHFKTIGGWGVVLLAFALYKYPVFYQQLENNPLAGYRLRQPYKGAAEWLLMQPEIEDGSTAFFFCTPQSFYHGWYEYYVTKQGKIKPPNINIFDMDTVNYSYYDRIYLFVPWVWSPPIEYWEFLNGSYDLTNQLKALYISVYDKK